MAKTAIVISRKPFTKLSPFFTDHRLANQAPEALPMARTNPINNLQHH